MLPAVPAEPQFISDPEIIKSRYSAYLQDESRLSAVSVRSISFPKSSDEVAALLAHCSHLGESVAVSGGRTGLCGGAVPAEQSHILSLEKLKHFAELKEQVREGQTVACIEVGAGVTLKELQDHLAAVAPSYFFPVDPTEMSATVGGAINTNASGARSYHYGAMRRWVEQLTVVLASGHVATFRRGDIEVGQDGALSLSVQGIVRTVKLASIRKPQTKNVIGYEFHPGLDAVDLLVGSEGTLAVVTAAVLRLEPLPKGRLYFLQFFDSEDAAVAFVGALRQSSLAVLAIEYFDKNSLQLLRQNAATLNSRAATMLKESTTAGIFCDFVVESEERLLEVYELLEAELSKLGCSMEDSLAGTEDRDLRDIKVFRHAVPENINRILAERKKQMPALHKISTDMSVPPESFQAMNQFYKETLQKENLEYYIFGHIGDYHLHVNIIPRTEAELLRAKELYKIFAEKVVALHGAVAAEHGIGRIKKPFMQLQYDSETLGVMRQLKKFFDPSSTLNRSVLFDD